MIDDYEIKGYSENEDVRNYIDTWYDSYVRKITLPTV